MRIVLGLAFTAGCYDHDFRETRFKCDAQNGCADGSFCTNPGGGGICVVIGDTGCRGQDLTAYWGFDSASETATSGWTTSSKFNEGHPTASFETTHSVDLFAGKGSFEVRLHGMDTDTELVRGWIFMPQAVIGDLTGHVFSGSVKTSGAGVKVKANADAQPGFSSQFTPPVILDLDQWECVGMDLDHPPDLEPTDNYSPAQIRNLGFEIVGPLPMSILFDDIGF